jgi:hypothetical protein
MLVSEIYPRNYIPSLLLERSAMSPWLLIMSLFELLNTAHEEKLKINIEYDSHSLYTILIPCESVFRESLRSQLDLGI